jgi:predicted dehydrogenase
MLVDFAIHDFDQVNLHLGHPVAVTTVEAGASGRFESRIEYAAGGVGHVVTDPALPAGSPFESSLEVRGTAGTASFRYPDAASDEPFVRQAAYFLDCVETRRRPELCPPESAVLALRVALAARESLRSGRTIELPGMSAPVGVGA